MWWRTRAEVLRKISYSRGEETVTWILVLMWFPGSVNAGSSMLAIPGFKKQDDCIAAGIEWKGDDFGAGIEKKYICLHQGNSK